MAILVKDDLGMPIPQYKNPTTGNNEAVTGANGAVDQNVKSMPNGMVHTDGSLKATVENLTNDITLLDAVTVATVGTYVLQGEKTITVEIYGTSTSRTINFQGKGPSGTARTLMGVKLSDLTTGTSTTGTAEIWQFDVTGLTSFITNLTAVAGGNVSIRGRAVA